MVELVLNVSRQAEDEVAATLFVAIELSRAKWLVATFAPAMGDKVHVHQIAGGDARRLIALIEELRAKLKVRGIVRVMSCFEAGYDGFWLDRLLREHGVENHVLDGASLLVDRRAKHVKTDQVDVRRLLRALVGRAQGDMQTCRIVHPPTVDQEDARRVARERGRLVRERTGHINRIKALLTAQGIRETSIKSAKWAERIGNLRTGDGRPLPSKLRGEIEREWHRLKVLMEQLKVVEAERNEVARGEAPLQDIDGAKIYRLAKLRGIGADFATVLTREVFWRHFENRRAVARYFGLTPAPYDSGDSTRDQGIDKAGNPRARATAVELAWMWLRHQPQSELSRWFFRRTGEVQGRIRRVMIVGLARKLVIALWRYLETGRVPNGAVVKA